MQNDLISRSSLLKYMETTEILQYIDELNSGNDNYSSTVLYDFVKDMPTVYSVEDVITELEEELKKADEEKVRCISENPLQFDSAKGYATGISNALDIVRKGGVNNATN